MTPDKAFGPGFGQSLRELVRTSRDRTLAGYIAEAEVFDDFDGAGVPCIRCPENYPYDGAFVRDSHVLGLETSLERYLWACQTDKSEFLPFDVKTSTYKPGDEHGATGYTFSGAHASNEEAKVYIVVFQDVDDYVAIVPNHVWEVTSHRRQLVGYGLQTLIAKVPFWAFPFMVYQQHYRDAVASLAASTEHMPYRNPTTGVVFDGWWPSWTTSITKSRNPEILGAHIEDIVSELCRQVDICSSEFTALWNPVAPLICDFILTRHNIDMPVRIEHKFSSLWKLNGPFSFLNFGSKEASPFRPKRLWHFVICQNNQDAEISDFLCIRRGQVDVAWTDPDWDFRLTYDQYSKCLIEGPGAMNKVLKRIADEASAAFAEVDAAARFPVSDSGSTSDLVASNHAQSYKERVAQLEAQTQADPVAGLTHHAKTLPWLAQAFNEKFAQLGYVLCFSLGFSHPISDHVFVEHTWSSEDRTNFEIGSLPLECYSPRLAGRRCIFARFIDMSGGATNVGDTAEDPLRGLLAPLVMREAYWTKPRDTQQFIFIGGTAPSDGVDFMDEYLFFPSDYTTMFDDFHDPDTNRNKLEKYVVVAHSRSRLLNPNLWGPGSLAHGRRPPFVRGSTFVKDPNTDPTRWVMKFDDSSLAQLIVALLDGHPSDVVVHPPQSDIANAVLDKTRYVTNWNKVFQSMWDYGLTLWGPSSAGDSEQTSLDAADVATLH